MAILDIWSIISENNNMYKVQQTDAKAYEKLKKRCLEVVDHSDGLGGRGGGA